jgi:hypothetical protein
LAGFQKYISIHYHPCLTSVRMATRRKEGTEGGKEERKEKEEKK